MPRIALLVVSSILRTLTLILLFDTLTGSPLAQTWQRLGPEGGMVLSLAADSDSDLYLGTNDGHVFGSRDRGAT